MNRALTFFIITCIVIGMSGCSLRSPNLAISTEQAFAQSDQLVLINIKYSAENTQSNIGLGGKPYALKNSYNLPLATRKIMANIANDYSLKAIDGWPMSPLGIYCQIMAAPEGVDLSTLITALAKDARVELVQPLNTFQTLSTPNQQKADLYNDPYFEAQFNGIKKNIVALHQKFNGNGIKVAIVDTGADIEHQDLEDQVTIARNFVNNDSATFLSDKHGTAIAGIIAAKPNNQTGIVGVAPNASLLILKACWYNQTNEIVNGKINNHVNTKANCNSFTLAKALLFALQADVDIINLSLSGPDDPLIERIIVKLIEKGIIVIAAEHTNTALNFPAKLPQVISSSSIGKISKDADIQAPGEEQLSTAPNNLYDFYTGNSIATAYVSGVTALLKQAYPGLTAAETMQIFTHKKPDPYCITASLLPSVISGKCSQL